METVQPISQPTEFTSTPRKRGKKKGLFIIIIVLLLIAGGVFGYTKMQSASNTASVSPTPEMPTPTAEPSPTEDAASETPTPEPKDTPEPTKKATPTPKAAATKASELNIQVLNGSGAEGVATTAKDFLSGKGYQFIETGNGDNFDYEGVTLKSKSSVADFVSSLKTDLEEKYTIKTESDTLSEDSLFDVVIIVGK